MRPAGLAAIESAKASGRWESAYQPWSNPDVPPDLQAALDAKPNAKAFFETLRGANRYAVIFRVQTAKKPETRARRIADFIARLERKGRRYSGTNGKPPRTRTCEMTVGAGRYRTVTDTLDPCDAVVRRDDRRLPRRAGP